MGYTHYWSNESRANDFEWTGLMTDIAAIISTAKNQYMISVCYEFDRPNKKPYLSQEFVRFNGILENGRETFLLERAATDFAFCKTGREDYDAIVIACLIAANNWIPGFKWWSDGTAEEHVDGMRLFMDATGNTL